MRFVGWTNNSLESCFLSWHPLVHVMCCVVYVLLKCPYLTRIRECFFVTHRLKIAFGPWKKLNFRTRTNGGPKKGHGPNLQFQERSSTCVPCRSTVALVRTYVYVPVAFPKEGLCFSYHHRRRVVTCSTGTVQSVPDNKHVHSGAEVSIPYAYNSNKEFHTNDVPIGSYPDYHIENLCHRFRV